MSVNEESVVPDQNMDEPDKDESMGPPARSKKKKMKKIQPLKRKATGPIGGIGARKLNMSLNSSVVKQTLRSNNRSLARALEMARQEYSVLQQQFVELQTHQLDFERRTKKRLGDLHTILDTVSLKLTNSVSLLAEAQSLCSIDQCMDATVINNTILEETIVQPRPVAKRILTPASLPSATITDQPVPLDNNDRQESDEAVEESPTADPEAAAQAEVVTNEIIETMRQDLSHVVTSLQGCKAPPVSLPPLDVSVVMEQSYFIDQVPLMFADEDGDESQKDVAQRRRGHSRSRSGRRSAMVYKTSIIDSDLSEGSLPTAGTGTTSEEKGPRRSLRARSKSRQSRQDLRKTIGEDVQEEPQVVAESDNVSNNQDTPTKSPENLPTESQPIIEPSVPEVISVPEIVVQDLSSTEKALEEPIQEDNKSQSNSDNEVVSGSGSESNAFKPKKEIPRTPPSRRASASVEEQEAEREMEPEAVGIEIPRFISLETDNSTKVKKANKKRLSTKSLKKNVKPSARTSLEPVKPVKKVDAEKRKVSEEKVSPPEIEETIEATEEDEDKTLVEEVENTITEEKVEEPKTVARGEKVEESPKLKSPEKEEEPTKSKSPEKAVATDNQLGKRRSHLRRGTFNLANKAPINYAELDEEEDSVTQKPVALPEAEPPKRSQRQRRGTYCLPVSKPEAASVPSEDTSTEITKKIAEETIKEKNKKELRQKRGTYFVANDDENEDVPAENEQIPEPDIEDELMDDLENEQEITLVDGIDSDDNCPTEDVPAVPTNMNDFGSETICAEEDMELTEVLNIPLHLDKIPVPSFIKKSLEKAGEEETKKAHDKEEKSNIRKKLVPKLKKKKPEEKNDVGKSSAEDQPEKDSRPIRPKDKSDSKDKEQVQSSEKESDNDFVDSFKKPDIRMLKPLAKIKAKAAKQAKEKEQKVTDSESSDSDKEKAKFQAVLEKPGKIVFKAGRKNVEEIKSQVQKFVQGKPRSKVKSLLPRPGKPRSKNARSKTRLLSLDSEMKLGFEAKKPKEPGLNSVFDMSLNESITVLPQMSYGDFREQNPSMEAMKAALKSGQNTEAVSDDASPHGIMLVMGNGKRTKPRVRSKSVSYARKLAEVHLRTPSASSCSDTSPTKNTKVFAGNTPPRPKPKSPEQPSEEDVMVPDTPEFRFLKKSKRSLKEPKDISDKVLPKKSIEKVDDSVRDSLSCSTNSRLSSTNDSVFEKSSNQAVDEQVKTSEVKEAKAKKRQSQVKQAPTGSEKKRKQKAQESALESEEKVSEQTESSNVGKKARESTDSKRGSTSKRSLNQQDEFKVPAAVDIEPKRPRRGASQVSYKEPSLHTKMRRDPTSKEVSKEGEHDIKRRKSEKRSRSVLTTITNTHDNQ